MPTTILFVEDNDDLRKNAALVLEIEGYNVQVASDGQEALEILENGFVPDLIVSDIMMPRLDGYGFFHEVRQNRRLKAIPFIFLTAKGSRRDITEGRILGADDYLTKPFDPQEFLIAIESRLRRAADMREEASENLYDARRQLVELLSHELKTPLTYVTGGFALLAEELKAQAEQFANQDLMVSLDLIQNGTQRLNRLAEQMVLYSQVLSGLVKQRVEERGKPEEVLFLVNSAVASLMLFIQAHDTPFEQSFPPDTDLMVWGVSHWLITGIGEVIRNAVQYSPPDAPVKLVTERDGNYVKITVIDQGPGIKPEDQETIWDVLIQSERDQQEQQGAGMGLPIVKGIIEAHGGKVELFSKLDEGTRVMLWLPLLLE